MNVPISRQPEPPVEPLSATPERSRLVEFYEAQLELYGPEDPRSLHWISRNTQHIRFQVLYEELGSWHGVSVADIGCGLGDLCGFLQEQGHLVHPRGESAAVPKPRSVAYAGYDLSPKLVAAAAHKYPQGRFCVRDILEEGLAQPCDYVVASGTLNIRVADHDRFFCSIVQAMYHGCTQAVAFNFLGPPDYKGGESLYFSIEPEKVVEYCRTLTPDVHLRQGYLPGDFTVVMRKGGLSERPR